MKIKPVPIRQVFSGTAGWQHRPLRPYKKRSNFKIIQSSLMLILWMLPLLSCSISSDIPFIGSTRTPTPSPTATFTPTPTATPTPVPTPTPQPGARIQSGDQALLEGDWDKALSEFANAQQVSGDPQIQIAAQLGIGRTQLYSGNIQEAAATLEALIQNYGDAPQAAQAHFFLAQAYSKLEKYTEAAQSYLNYLTLRSGVIDGYVLDLRGDALFAAGNYAEAAKDYQAARNVPSLNDELAIEMKEARAISVSGDTATALKMYDDVYARTEDEHTKALIDLRKGQIYTGLGQMSDAYAAYQDAVENYPTSYDSYSALLALVDASQPVSELNRGLVDYFAGKYGPALAAFDRYLQSAPQDPGTAYYYEGQSTLYLGDYPMAIAAWDKIIQNYPTHRFWDKAIEQKAYTQWAYLDQYPEAIQTLLDFVKVAPNHPRAGEFLFDAAQVAERAGKLDQAASLWEKVSNQYPGYEQANRALFLAGISRYRMGDFSAAYATFQRLLAISTTLGDRAMATLWIGKAQNARGDATAALQAWEQAASVDPTGYYSERARDLARNRPPFTPPQAYDLALDEASERAKADSWMRSTFSLPANADLTGLGSLANDPYFQRGSELWALGLYNEARNEFELLRQASKSDPVQSYQLANYLAKLGLYRTASLASRQVLTLAGMDDAGTMNAPLWFNRLRFGTYYSDLINQAAQENGFHPLFLFSVVRQESLFESFANSSAAAGGLMQIIPSTGESIAKNLGWPKNYSASDLFRPVVSIRLGTYYLAAQRSSFDGDLYAALAAYNGGPGNSAEWKKLSQGDPDLFVEVIRYSETRDYIRMIYEIFSIYRNLYNRTP